jgi:hypothetical protein
VSSGDLKPLAQKVEMTLSLVAVDAFSIGPANGMGFANCAKALGN